MKNLLNYSKIWSFLLVLSFLIFTACDDDKVEEVIPTPTASFTFSPDAPEVGEEITFTSTSENADSFSWSFGDGNTATEGNATHTYESSGEFTVTLVASGEGGEATVNKTLSVSSEPTATLDPVEIYFADNTGGVFTIQKISGIGIETTVETAFETTGYTYYVFYDKNNNKIYYSDDDNGQVVRVNPDGSEEEIVAEDIEGPRGIALDDDASQLFVAASRSDEILSFNLSTGDKTVLYDSTDLVNAEGAGSFPSLYYDPHALVFHNGDLIFSCPTPNSQGIWKAAADGSVVERILDISDAGYIWGITLDAGNDKMIFDESKSSHLVSANLDGSSISELVEFPEFSRTYGMGIDYKSSKLYWSTTDGSVKRANRDGSEVEILVDANEERENRGLVVVPIN